MVRLLLGLRLLLLLSINDMPVGRTGLDSIEERGSLVIEKSIVYDNDEICVYIAK